MKRDEIGEAYFLAEKLLDDTSADPDDDLRLLSRQLLRHKERIEGLRVHKKALTEEIVEKDRLLGISLNLTERKSAEIERLTKRLERAEEMVSESQSAKIRRRRIRAG